MLKTITAFRIANRTRELLNYIADNGVLPEPTIKDPAASAWQTNGFAAPDHFGGQPFYCIDGITLLDFQTRERVLPGRVIRTKVAEKVAEISESEGRKVGRKELMQIKDDLLAQLLPTAFIKPADTYIVIYHDWLLIATSSVRIIDLAITALRNLFPDDRLEIEPINDNRPSSISTYMADILLSGTTGGGLCDRGRTVSMRSVDKATARFKDMSLDAEAVVDRMSAGFVPTEIEVQIEEQMSFVMTDRLVIKRIAFSDIISESVSEMMGEEGSAAGNFDATVIIEVKTITGMLTKIISNEEIGSDDGVSRDEDQEL